MSIDSISLWSCKILLECCLRPATKEQSVNCWGFALSSTALCKIIYNVSSRGEWVRRRARWLLQPGRIQPLVQKLLCRALTISESTLHLRNRTDELTIYITCSAFTVQLSSVVTLEMYIESHYQHTLPKKKSLKGKNSEQRLLFCNTDVAWEAGLGAEKWKRCYNSEHAKRMIVLAGTPPLPKPHHEAGRRKEATASAILGFM